MPRPAPYATAGAARRDDARSVAPSARTWRWRPLATTSTRSASASSIRRPAAAGSWLVRRPAAGARRLGHAGRGGAVRARSGSAMGHGRRHRRSPDLREGSDSGRRQAAARPAPVLRSGMTPRAALVRAAGRGEPATSPVGRRRSARRRRRCSIVAPGPPYLRPVSADSGLQLVVPAGRLVHHDARGRDRAGHAGRAGRAGPPVAEDRTGSRLDGMRLRLSRRRARRTCDTTTWPACQAWRRSCSCGSTHDRRRDRGRQRAPVADALRRWRRTAPTCPSRRGPSWRSAWTPRAAARRVRTGELIGGLDVVDVTRDRRRRSSASAPYSAYQEFGTRYVGAPVHGAGADAIDRAAGRYLPRGPGRRRSTTAARKRRRTGPCRRCS